MGFAASTGAAINNHVIKDVSIGYKFLGEQVYVQMDENSSYHLIEQDDDEAFSFYPDSFTYLPSYDETGEDMTDEIDDQGFVSFFGDDEE